VSPNSQSTPARLTAPATVKLPRLMLFVLAFAYIVAGLFGRDPWKTDDVVGLATMLTAFNAQGHSWLLPHIGSFELTQDGPLVMWVGAAMIRIFGPMIGVIHAAQLATTLWFAMTLGFVWYGTYLLGRRAEAQPLALPFGGEPTVKDYGRLIADAASLLLIATAGVLLRLHETSFVPALIACYSLGFYAMARMLDKPLVGSTMLGIALAGAFLTRAWPGVLALLFAIPIAFLPRGALWVRRFWLIWTLLLAIGLGMGWWLAGMHIDPDWMSEWMHWNRQAFGLPDSSVALRPFSDLPWFLWPIWPLAILALWQWRRWMTAPHILIPASLVLGLFLLLPILSESGEHEFVLLVAPMAVLASFALPTMRRGVINTLDWFALMCFSVTAVCAWIGWVALHFGIPHGIQLNIQRQTAGFEPVLEWWRVIAAVFVTMIWVGMVIWRLRRHPSVLWRGAVLCAAGITTTWLLLVLLWMPAVDYVRSYRPMSAQIKTVLDKISNNGGPNCVRAQGLSLGPQASLYVFDNINFTYDSSCPFVLQQTTRKQLENDTAGYSDGATVLWIGSRGADRFDRYRLLRVKNK